MQQRLFSGEGVIPEIYKKIKEGTVKKNKLAIADNLMLYGLRKENRPPHKYITATWQIKQFKSVFGGHWDVVLSEDKPCWRITDDCLIPLPSVQDFKSGEKLETVQMTIFNHFLKEVNNAISEYGPYEAFSEAGRKLFDEIVASKPKISDKSL